MTQPYVWEEGTVKPDFSFKLTGFEGWKYHLTGNYWRYFLLLVCFVWLIGIFLGGCLTVIGIISFRDFDMAVVPAFWSTLLFFGLALAGWLIKFKELRQRYWSFPSSREVDYLLLVKDGQVIDVVRTWQPWGKIFRGPEELQHEVVEVILGVNDKTKSTVEVSLHEIAILGLNVSFRAKLAVSVRKVADFQSLYEQLSRVGNTLSIQPYLRNKVEVFITENKGFITEKLVALFSASVLSGDIKGVNDGENVGTLLGLSRVLTPPIFDWVKQNFDQLFEMPGAVCLGKSNVQFSLSIKMG